MTARPWMLSEQTLPGVRAAGYQVAVLPWGATEAHNLHLPYGTDNVESAHVAAEAAALAWTRGARVAVLPGVPFGVNTTQLDIPFTLNVMPSTQLALLGDLAASLDGQGIRKLVVLNGHGGNDFKAIIRELHPRTRLFISAVQWWQVVDARPFFDAPGDHAGELETSAMLHIAPALVRPLDEAGPGAARAWRLAGLREGVAWAPRDWMRVTDDTGIGDPRAATAEKGARFLAAAIARIADYFVELAAADADDLYERPPSR
jgi:creatinine amidohydrolase